MTRRWWLIPLAAVAVVVALVFSVNLLAAPDAPDLGPAVVVTPDPAPSESPSSPTESPDPIETVDPPEAESVPPRLPGDAGTCDPDDDPDDDDWCGPGYPIDDDDDDDDDDHDD